MAAPTRAALLRDVSGIFAAGGVYLCATPLPTYKNLLEACGFQRVPEARNTAWGIDSPVDGYMLDLSRIGFESWIEALLSERPPAISASQMAMLERELRAALRHWRDDRWLVRSPLARAMIGGDGTPRPKALRESIRRALAKQTDERFAYDESEDIQCYRALELAYLTPSVTRKQAVRSLAVSRATFYRLVNEGVAGLARAISRN